MICMTGFLLVLVRSVHESSETSPSFSFILETKEEYYGVNGAALPSIALISDSTCHVTSHVACLSSISPNVTRQPCQWLALYNAVYPATWRIDF